MKEKAYRCRECGWRFTSLFVPTFCERCKGGSVIRDFSSIGILRHSPRLFARRGYHHSFGRELAEKYPSWEDQRRAAEARLQDFYQSDTLRVEERDPEEHLKEVGIEPET